MVLSRFWRSCNWSLTRLSCASVRPSFELLPPPPLAVTVFTCSDAAFAVSPRPFALASRAATCSCNDLTLASYDAISSVEPVNFTALLTLDNVFARASTAVLTPLMVLFSCVRPSALPRLSNSSLIFVRLEASWLNDSATVDCASFCSCSAACCEACPSSLVAWACCCSFCTCFSVDVELCDRSSLSFCCDAASWLSISMSSFSTCAFFFALPAACSTYKSSWACSINTLPPFDTALYVSLYAALSCSTSSILRRSSCSAAGSVCEPMSLFPYEDASRRTSYILLSSEM